MISLCKNLYMSRTLNMISYNRDGRPAYQHLCLYWPSEEQYPKRSIVSLVSLTIIQAKCGIHTSDYYVPVHITLGLPMFLCITEWCSANGAVVYAVFVCLIYALKPRYTHVPLSVYTAYSILCLLYPLLIGNSYLLCLSCHFESTLGSPLCSYTLRFLLD
jgi:hypothetical protein